jgi:hypothetical protein
MGAFIVNFHVRTKNHDELVRALLDLAKRGCWVTAPKDGWATVYEERASTQDDTWIRELGTKLSDRLHTSAAAFLIHDSDFLCYWLFEEGAVVDEYNSCPDYFDGVVESDNGDAEKDQGQPDVLLRFCRPGTRLLDLANALNADPTFAEEQLQHLVGYMGIDPERALADYRDLDTASAGQYQAMFIGDKPANKKGAARSGPATLRFPGVAQSADDEEDGDDDDGEIQGTGPGGAITADQIARMMGLPTATTPADPLVAELVQAAADGKVSEVERLVAAGANLDGEAPMTLSSVGNSPLSARVLAGRNIAFPVTPLVAAVSNKRVDVARRLLELGANVHTQARMFGSPLHGAVSAGSPELVRMMLDAGADANEKNKQGQTPIGALQHIRMVMGQMEALKALGGAMFKQIEPELNRLVDNGGWEQCEKLLRERGGQ